MQLSSLECYATAKLNCGYADLEMLDNVYSKLAEDSCYDLDEIVDRTDDINELLYEVYWQISSKVQDQLMYMVDNKEPVELVINDQCVTFEITDEQAEKLKELAEGLTEESPFCNCLDTHFQNDLDQTVDWDKDAWENALDLVKYWIENEELQMEEEKEIVAYVLSEDGYDKDYEEYYVLRGKKVYKDDECICDMSDEDEIDENFISERICEDLSPDFVKSIDLEDTTIFENPEDFDTEEDEDME